MQGRTIAGIIGFVVVGGGIFIFVANNVEEDFEDLAVDNPRAARHLLNSHPLDSYDDFLKRRNDALTTKLQMKVAQHREALAQLLDLLDTKAALRYLASPDEDEREFAAASFRKRAEKGKIKPEDADAVARVLQQVFDEEIRRPTMRPATLDNVTATLVHFLEDEKLQK